MFLLIDLIGFGKQEPKIYFGKVQPRSIAIQMNTLDTAAKKASCKFLEKNYPVKMGVALSP